jgi:3-polyprenyl-4-hydroxybenzoate decarboxylase
MSLGVQSRKLMDRIKMKSVGLICPAFTDDLIGREALECFKAARPVIVFGRLNPAGKDN